MIMVKYSFDNGYRYTDLSQGTKDELLSDAMMSKLKGDMAGYQIFDLSSIEQYKENKLNYDFMQEHLVVEWFDKDAFRGAKPSGPGSIRSKLSAGQKIIVIK